MQRERKISNVFILFSLFLLGSCASYAAVPIKEDANSLFFLVSGKLDGQKVSLLLDTGSSYPLLSEAYAEKQGLATYVREIEMPSVGGYFSQPKSSGLEHGLLRFHDAGNLRIGSAIFINPSPFIVADLSMIRQAAGQSVDGIIGGGVLNGDSYQIDFASRKMKLGNFNGHSTPYPLELSAQYLFAEGKVNGVRDKFLIDSGASMSTISKELTSKLDLRAADSIVEKFRVVTVEGVQIVERTRIALDSFEFGSAKFRSIYVAVSDKNVIGLDLLSSGVLDIDPSAGRFGFVLSGDN